MALGVIVTDTTGSSPCRQTARTVTSRFQKERSEIVTSLSAGAGWGHLHLTCRAKIFKNIHGWHLGGSTLARCKKIYRYMYVCVCSVHRMISFGIYDLVQHQVLGIPVGARLRAYI